MPPSNDKSSFKFEFMNNVLFLIDDVTLYDIDRIYNTIWKELKHYKYNSLEINLRFVTKMDSSGVALINQIKSS